MTDDIIIDGVTMPTPALGGLTIKKEKVWSNNTGRVANGDMVGDLIAIKYTLEITWPMLSRADAAKIDAAISPAFFNVTFPDNKEMLLKHTILSGIQLCGRCENIQRSRGDTDRKIRRTEQ